MKKSCNTLCCSFQHPHRNVIGAKVDKSEDCSKIEQMSMLSGILMHDKAIVQERFLRLLKLLCKMLQVSP